MTTCVIIDDEPLAIEILVNYITQVKEIALVKTFTNPVDALSFVQQHQVNLIFLDIEMPLFNGLDFIKTLNYRPAVIVTTAYRDYAVESFELEAVDYLVKPIPFHRFIKATSKITSMAVNIKETNVEDADSTTNMIADEDLWLKTDKKLIRVSPADIIYIESLKDYIRIKTKYSELITYLTLAGMMEKLPPNKFIRIHKSYIISLHKVDIIEGNMVRIADKVLPIGRSFRQGLIDKISTYNS